MKPLLGACAVVLAAIAQPVCAQGYPTKPVHAIISFTPGSSTDIVGRRHQAAVTAPIRP